MLMELQINNLVVDYGTIRALHGVSLNCAQGELVALIGSNGAGKSTTLMTVSGVVRPTEGTIMLGGKNITKVPAHEIASLGIAQVPEGRRVFPRLTVHENLFMGAYIMNDKNLVKERLDYVYHLFPRLLERKGQTAGNLSGGEQQMLAMGRALIRKPSFLLLDEPSLGLAPVVVETIFDVIASLIKESEVGILLVEQNAGIALSVANRGYVMETGKITIEALAKDLLTDERVKAAYIG
jgi:branched-chain amino acid transport system ATP-binding protein